MHVHGALSGEERDGPSLPDSQFLPKSIQASMIRADAQPLRQDLDGVLPRAGEDVETRQAVVDGRISPVGRKSLQAELETFSNAPRVPDGEPVVGQDRRRNRLSPLFQSGTVNRQDVSSLGISVEPECIAASAKQFFVGDLLDVLHFARTQNTPPPPGPVTLSGEAWSYGIASSFFLRVAIVFSDRCPAGSDSAYRTVSSIVRRAAAASPFAA